MQLHWSKLKMNCRSDDLWVQMRFGRAFWFNLRGVFEVCFYFWLLLSFKRLITRIGVIKTLYSWRDFSSLSSVAFQPAMNWATPRGSRRVAMNGKVLPVGWQSFLRHCKGFCFVSHPSWSSILDLNAQRVINTSLMFENRKLTERWRLLAVSVHSNLVLNVSL